LVKTPSQEVRFTAAAKESARLYATAPHQFIDNEDTVARCVSHSLFTIMPSPDRMVETVEIKTTYLRDLIANAIAEADTAKQVGFFNLTSNHPWFRVSAGYIFQKFVFTWLFSNPVSGRLLCTPADPTNGSFELHSVGPENVFVFDGARVLIKAKCYITSGWLPSASATTYAVGSSKCLRTLRQPIVTGTSVLAIKYGMGP
jgi:hypothetical protein